MDIIFVRTDNRQVIASTPDMPTLPMPGDIFVTPDEQAFRVVQRAFILEKVTKPKSGIVNLRESSNEVSLTAQVVVLP